MNDTDEQPDLNAALESATYLQPLHHKVLVLPEPPKKKTDGGIILPDSARDAHEYNVDRGWIIALGASCFNDWQEDPDKRPKPGDFVQFRKYMGDAFTDPVSGQKMRLVMDNEIFQIMHKTEGGNHG